MAVEVKGGRNIVRELRGVLGREKAQMVGLIILHPLGDTKAHNFRREMAQAGDIDIAGTDYPRMQMLTVAEVLDGQRFNTPGAAGRGLAQTVLLGTAPPTSP